MRKDGSLIDPSKKLPWHCNEKANCVEEEFCRCDCKKCRHAQDREGLTRQAMLNVKRLEKEGHDFGIRPYQPLCLNCRKAFPLLVKAGFPVCPR